jgi:hypothetical protein
MHFPKYFALFLRYLNLIFLVIYIKIARYRQLFSAVPPRKLVSFSHSVGSHQSTVEHQAARCCPVYGI